MNTALRVFFEDERRRTVVKLVALFVLLAVGGWQSEQGFTRAIGLVGCFTTVGLAFAMSSQRKKIDWNLVSSGLLLQVVFALLILRTDLGRGFFETASSAVNRLLSFTGDGARFVFGNLIGPTVPVTSKAGGALDYVAETGALMAFGVLPTILFFSALTAFLYHVGVMQKVVRALGGIMRRTMRISGAESLSASANIFVGQTEAPLVIKPYLARMTTSELMAVMTGGFATVAGGVMAVYVGILSGVFPDIAGHLIAASVMSAPASLVLAKIVVPETETPETSDGVSKTEESSSSLDANALDAITRGTSEGLQLALNVCAMLIAFVALVSLVNFGLSSLGSLFSVENLTLERIFGVVFAPFAYVLGVPWDEAASVGALMGKKTAVNEFVAYLDLDAMIKSGSIHSEKAKVIATYALCGFSNFSSIGIQIGGLASIAPERRHDLARLGLRAMIAGSLACFQTGAIAGMLL